MNKTKLLIFIGLILALLAVGQSFVKVQAAPAPESSAVPEWLQGSLEPPVQPLDLPVFVGVYSSGPLQSSAWEITEMDTWLGAPTVTIAGTFLDIESLPTSIVAELDAAWNAGYVPFVNLGAGTDATPHTAAEIANGAIDTAIRTWAVTFRDWSNNGQKRAMIAPLQEMNGDWTSYGMDPANFKLAYYRVLSIFAQEGVLRNSVMWVFAPNGWSLPAHEFEFYYPGDTFVDAIGYSSFNFGACPTGTDNDTWGTFFDIHKPYIERMVEMAPTKPIIVAEIGSVVEYGNRENWITDALTKFSQYPNVRGWIYFNRSENRPTLQDCVPTDYRVYKPETDWGSDAFKNKVTQAPYGHWAQTDTQVTDVMFNPIKGYFRDINEVAPFSGQSSPWYTSFINRLFEAGITGGCRATTIDLPGDDVIDPKLRDYCPSNQIKRSEMAVFLERGIRGSDYTPPAATGAVFTDVPASHWAAAWIEQLRLDGITGGCWANPPAYCPESPVTRAQMAVFLLRARHGFDYTPPAATGTIFADVPVTHWAAAWIEQLYQEGITAGCTVPPASPSYCPESPNLRREMAVFLVRTFNLP